MSDVVRLTPEFASRKLQVLGFIKRYLFEHGESPSLGEIASGCAISRKHAMRIRNRLAAQRLIVVRGGPRGISLPHDGSGSRIDVLLQLQAEGFRILPPPGAEATKMGLPIAFDLAHPRAGGDRAEQQQDDGGKRDSERVRQ